VSVNLSARQFARGGLAAHVESVLSDASISPGELRLEVTESSLMHDPELAFRTMKDLEALGVGLHMDDFGTGYSSLNHLHRFPFDTLKIDRSFVQGIAEHQDSRNIVKTIVELAKAFEMQVVAEGIETAVQAEHLRNLGCHFGQGYYFSRPVTPEEISEMLKSGGMPN
jgi:EAL domain-containing protein (putative c-di-GMP-specific phosphodiesterase class I)